MTLAKNCHASNMMQDFVKPTPIAITKVVWCFNCSVIVLE